MAQVKQAQDTNATSVALAGHFFLTHFLAAGAGLLTWGWLATAELPPRLAISLGMAGLAGLILTINIQRSIRVLDWALVHLSTAVPIQDLPRWGHGPLAGVVARLHGLVERERPFTELRAQQTKQTSEAAAQEERNRLARDLHDSIKQQLFSIHVGTAAVQARWQNDPDGAKVALEDVRQSAQAALVEMNALLGQLSPEPLAKVGLVEALRQQCQALGYRTGADVQTAIGPLPDDERFPDGAPEAIFRIAQEALSNIARHARAQTVRLRLEQENDSLLLAIEDDGQGFDTGRAANGMGLANLRQRVQDVGGELTIHSQPDAGTAIRVSIPLQESLQMKESRMNKPDHLFNQVSLVGIGGGVALMLVLFYPLVIVLPGRFVPEWPQGWLFLGWLLALTAVPLHIGIGYLAAKRAETTTRPGSQFSGAVAGSVAAAIFFFGMGGAAAALMSNQALFEHGLIPAASNDVFLWLLTEIVTSTVWWTLGSFVVLVALGALLGAVGGRLAPLSMGKPGRNWTQMKINGANLAFSALMSGLMSLVVTIAIYGLLGAKVMENAEKLSAMGVVLSLPPMGTAVLPITVTFLIYIATQIILYQLLHRIEQARPLPQVNSIVIAYMSAYISVLLPLLLFTGFIIPDETNLSTITVTIGGCLINVGMGLLLLKTAVALERRYPHHKRRPGWANWVTTALFLAFIIAASLAITEVTMVGLGVLGVVTAVYLFTPRHDFGPLPSSRAHILPRLMELSLAQITGFLITAWVTVPTALGLLTMPVNVINVLDPTNAITSYDGTAVGMVQGLYQSHPAALLILSIIPAFMLLLVFLVARISEMVRGSQKQ